METKQNLKVVRLTDGNLIQILEGAIRLGLPVLLEELGEKLDPALTPILLRQVYTKVRSWLFPCCKLHKALALI